MRKLLKITRRIILIAIFIIMISLTFIYIYVRQNAHPYLYEQTQDLPHNKVGLLLGTSKFVKKGNINLFYKYRIEAAVKLFKTKKIDYIIVSGDNREKNYNEPETMTRDLIKKGIPANRIIADYAGIRTLDSVIRSREIFGQSRITIISQKFHNERAICIANHKNINAVAFNAQDVPFRYGIKVEIREIFARVKMTLDLLCNKKPKHLGKKIQIP